MSEPSRGPIRLTDEDVAFLLMVLRNSPQPLSTQQLIEALRTKNPRG